MRPSPARKSAPEPESWIPIESLESLPELEELLDPKNLVDSGQTRAVRMGEDGRGYVFIDPELEATSYHEHKENLERSRRLWQSKHRTLKLQKRNKFLKATVVVLILTLMGSFATWSVSKLTANTPRAAHYQTVSWAVPVAIPVIIEGQSSLRFSFATSIKGFMKEQGLSGLAAMNTSFDRNDYVAKRSTPALEFRYPKVIALNADGVTRNIETTDLTVGDVLVNNGIVLDGDDVSVPAQTAAAKGVTGIAITRVSTTTRSEQAPVAFTVEKRNDSTLLKGTTKTSRDGKNGTQTITYTQTLKDGVVASEVESSRVVNVAPTSKVVLVGTKAPETQGGSATFYSAASGTCAHKTCPWEQSLL